MPSDGKETTSAAAAVRYIEVSDDEAGQRIDNFLLARLKGVPKSHVYRILRSGEVRVNSGRVAASHRLAEVIYQQSRARQESGARAGATGAADAGREGPEGQVGVRVVGDVSCQVGEGRVRRPLGGEMGAELTLAAGRWT